MPQSDIYNIPWLISIVRNLHPNSILDIGVGNGGYGFLLREFLDIAEGRLKPSEWTIQVDGIEIFENYHNPIWDYFYNDVRVADVTSILGELKEYNVILLIDVIEHFEKERGQALIRELLSKSEFIVISSPIGIYPQEAVYGNVYETHRSTWGKNDFAGLNFWYMEINHCFIVVVAKNRTKPIDNIFKNLPSLKLQKPSLVKRIKKMIRKVLIS